jgi:hypothetical protein
MITFLEPVVERMDLKRIERSRKMYTTRHCRNTNTSTRGANLKTLSCDRKWKLQIEIIMKMLFLGSSTSAYYAFRARNLTFYRRMRTHTRIWCRGKYEYIDERLWAAIESGAPDRNGNEDGFV